jgi:hypothetical protein
MSVCVLDEGNKQFYNVVVLKVYWVCKPKEGLSFYRVYKEWGFGPQRNDVAEEWRRLHNNELYALYSSPTIIRVIK